MPTSLAFQEDARSERACFDGLILSALVYGALVMLYVQLIQVLLRRPKRGRKFWFIVSYATILFPLTTFAFAGKLKFAEVMYITNRHYPTGPMGFYIANSSMWSNMMSQISTTLVPWVADPLMWYRIMVLWNNRWCLLLFPVMIYLSRVAMALPLLVSIMRPTNPLVHTASYSTARYALCFSLNLFTTTLICVRLYTMRHKAERVLGKLQASLYNSFITMFVESGALFTLWSLAYLVSKTRNSWVQEVFLQPYCYVMALARMLIILRMAQDRAWSQDIVNAADDGVLDWEVSSSNGSCTRVNPDIHQMERLPKKFRDDFSTKSMQ